MKTCMDDSSFYDKLLTETKTTLPALAIHGPKILATKKFLMEDMQETQEKMLEEREVNLVLL